MLRTSDEQLVQIPVGAVALEGTLALPPRAAGVVVFVHGSGSSRHSPRNTFVAQALQTAGLGTLLFDLLTKAEDIAYESRFDIDLLTRRLLAATRWLLAHPASCMLGLGYFDASTGAAAALQASVKTATLRAPNGSFSPPNGVPPIGESSTDSAVRAVPQADAGVTSSGTGGAARRETRVVRDRPDG